MALYALIPFHDLLRVDLQLLVWIHHNAEQAGVCLNEEQEEEENIFISQLEFDKITFGR